MKHLFNNSLFKWVFGLVAVLLIAVVFACVNTATGSGVVMMSPFILAGFTDEQSKSFGEWMEKQSEAIQTKVKSLIEAAKDGELLTELKTMIQGDGKESKGLAALIPIMQKQLDDQNIELQKMKVTPTNEKKTFASELREKMMAEIATLKKCSEKEAKAFVIEVKSFLETATASVTTGALIPTPQFEVGVTKAPDRMPFLLNLISSGATNALTIYWTQRKTRTDGTEWTAEGVAAAAQTVLGYEDKSASMKNLSEFIKVSNNSIEDIDWLLSEIQDELLTLMALKLDADLMNGTVAANGFDGVNTVATAFNANGKTLKAGVSPNKYDVLKFAARQIKRAHFRPDFVALNGDDILDMELERDENGGYLWPPYMNVTPQFAGIQIVENDGVTSGEFLIGDFKKAKWWYRKNVELKIWEQNENDVLTQMKTITLYMRGVLVVKDAHKLAFVKGTFTDAITEITNSI